MKKEKRTDLIDEIFSITGQKVAADDPIITAALFQSAVILEAGASVASELRKVTDDLIAASCSDRKVIAAVEEHFNAPCGRHAPLDSSQLQRLLQGLTNEIATVVKNEALLSVHLAWKSRIVMALLAALLLVGAAGMAIGVLFGPVLFPKLAPTLSQDQKSQIRAGKAILRVLPQLDREAREKLSKLLDQS